VTAQYRVVAILVFCSASSSKQEAESLLVVLGLGVRGIPCNLQGALTYTYKGIDKHSAYSCARNIRYNSNTSNSSYSYKQQSQTTFTDRHTALCGVICRTKSNRQTAVTYVVR
jgi:hypothetical protein